MCGICGIIKTFNKEERETYVKKMNGFLTHRGPNEIGFYSDDNATLAMSRLSIIDLQGGTQPLFNSSKTALVFFNGEIYNYKELKTDLQKKGYRFETHSDTEVIIHLYDEYKDKMTSFLKGMFAFCIYEIKTGKAFFARDRFGEKPLFYYKHTNGILFSSEIKSILSSPNIEKVLAKEFLPYYLITSYVPEPATLIKNLYSLPPGHQMVYQDNQLKIEKYFYIDYTIDKTIQTKEDAAAFINPYFNQAVKRQMTSDVPLGAFLSGGIDSSSVVAIMQENSSERIKTFNVKFEEASYDESHIAREVANKLGTEHYELKIPNADFTENIFWDIIDHVGFPFPDSSAIPTYILTKEIKKYVTVALSGDGGDELFAGYNLFDWYLKIQKIRTIPPVLRKSGYHLMNFLKSAPLVRNVSALRQIRKGLEVSLLQEEDIPIFMHAMFSNQDIDELYRTDPNINLALLKEYPPESAEWSPLRKIMYYRVKYNLPLDMLIKVDRMSMANSLEVRAPFLDADLFEASAKLPDKFLMENGVGKIIVREMMKYKLPEVVFNHPKSGFSIPLHRYQNNAFEGLCNDLLNENEAISQLFSASKIKAIVSQGLLNKNSDSNISIYKSSHQLWTLLQLAGWMKRFSINLPSYD